MLVFLAYSLRTHIVKDHVDEMNEGSREKWDPQQVLEWGKNRCMRDLDNSQAPLEEKMNS